MADIIKHKRSATASAVPTSGQLSLGELAINTADGRIYFKKSDGSVVAVALTTDSSGGGMVLVRKQQLFTASGTWTRPAAMVGNPTITMIGGGASGIVGGSRYGGDGGQWCIDQLVDIGATTSVSITIGAGGAASTTTSKNAGGSSSFGAFLTMLGAAGGTDITASTCEGAAGGNTSIEGAPTPLGYGGLFSGIGGGGGGIVVGASSPNGGVTAAGERAAKGYGAGGNGTGTGTSGAGAPGVCFVEWLEAITL